MTQSQIAARAQIQALIDAESDVDVALWLLVALLLLDA